MMSIMGPGTALKRILQRFNIRDQGGCGCEQHAQEMDTKGNAWCERNTNHIVNWMQQAASRRTLKLPLVRPLAKRLVLRAVKQSRKSGYDDMNWPTYFEKVFCISLRRRADRWEEFITGMPDDWPFAEVERFDAIDGKLCKHPTWWRQGGGAWGCYRSHLAILEHCLNTGVQSVLFLEDDAMFGEGFVEKAKQYLTELPRNWQMLYLGGQHLQVNEQPPKAVTDWVYQPYNVNRTHAYAIRGPWMMRQVYQHLTDRDWKPRHHIDHHLGRLHQQRKHRIYCPKEWLVGQRENRSNIAGRTFKERTWKDAERITKEKPETQPFVAVIGLHASGSSCLAGVLYHLGVHLGNTLTGFYGNNPQKSCGFEAVRLRDICEQAIPFPSVQVRNPKGRIVNNLRPFINEKRREAFRKKTIAGGKYPMLCRLGPQLKSVCGDQLRIIHIDRPIEESIESLIRRSPKHNAAKLEAHQRWLHEGKLTILASHPNHLAVQYHNLLADPRREIDRLIGFLEIRPTQQQIQKALAYVDPKQRHIHTEALDATA